MSQLASKSKEQIKQLRARAEELTVRNDRIGYDAFWGDDELVDLYLEPGRIDNFRHVARLCADWPGACIDLGCGVGTMLQLLAAQDRLPRPSLTGIDYSAAAIEQSRRRVPTGNFRVGDVYRTPFADASFGLVLSIQTMEHLDAPIKAFHEMWRLCAVGGRIVITVPNGAIDNWEGHANFWTEESFVEMAQRPAERIERINADRNLLFVFKKD